MYPDGAGEKINATSFLYCSWGLRCSAAQQLSPAISQSTGFLKSWKQILSAWRSPSAERNPSIIFFFNHYFIFLIFIGRNLQILYKIYQSLSGCSLFASFSDSNFLRLLSVLLASHQIVRIGSPIRSSARWTTSPVIILSRSDGLGQK